MPTEVTPTIAMGGIGKTFFVLFFYFFKKNCYLTLLIIETGQICLRLHMSTRFCFCEINFNYTILLLLVQRQQLKLKVASFLCVK